MPPRGVAPEAERQGAEREAAEDDLHPGAVGGIGVDRDVTVADESAIDAEQEVESAQHVEQHRKTDKEKPGNGGDPRGPEQDRSSGRTHLKILQVMQSARPVSAPRSLPIRRYAYLHSSRQGGGFGPSRSRTVGYRP